MTATALTLGGQHRRLRDVADRALRLRHERDHLGVRALHGGRAQRVRREHQLLPVLDRGRHRHPEHGLGEGVSDGRGARLVHRHRRRPAAPARGLPQEDGGEVGPAHVGAGHGGVDDHDEVVGARRRRRHRQQDRAIASPPGRRMERIPLRGSYRARLPNGPAPRLDPGRDRVDVDPPASVCIIRQPRPHPTFDPRREPHDALAHDPDRCPSTRRA